MKRLVLDPLRPARAASAPRTCRPSACATSRRSIASASNADDNAPWNPARAVDRAGRRLSRTTAPVSRAGPRLRAGQQRHALRAAGQPARLGGGPGARHAHADGRRRAGRPAHPRSAQRSTRCSRAQWRYAGRASGAAVRRHAQGPLPTPGGWAASTSSTSAARCGDRLVEGGGFTGGRPPGRRVGPDRRLRVRPRDAATASSSSCGGTGFDPRHAARRLLVVLPLRGARILDRACSRPGDYRCRQPRLISRATSRGLQQRQGARFGIDARPHADRQRDLVRRCGRTRSRSAAGTFERLDLLLEHLG